MNLMTIIDKEMMPILKNVIPDLQYNDNISDSLNYPLAMVACSMQKDILDDPKHKLLTEYLDKTERLKYTIEEIENEQKVIRKSRNKVSKKELTQMILRTQMKIDQLGDETMEWFEEYNKKLDEERDNLLKAMEDDDSTCDITDLTIIVDDRSKYILRFNRLHKHIVKVFDADGNRIDITEEFIDKVNSLNMD